jgi:transcriptional regulator with XRE-family HTH domain
VLLTTLTGMPNVPDSTESLLGRTKKLLSQRDGLSLREIAEGAGVGHQWVRGLVYGAIKDPGISRLEKLHNFLADYQAAKRYELRKPEPRAS